MARERSERLEMFGLESELGGSHERTKEREMDKTKKPEKSAIDRSRTSKKPEELKSGLTLFSLIMRFATGLISVQVRDE